MGFNNVALQFDYPTSWGTRRCEGSEPRISVQFCTVLRGECLVTVITVKDVVIAENIAKSKCDFRPAIIFSQCRRRIGQNCRRLSANHGFAINLTNFVINADFVISTFLVNFHVS